MQLRGEMTNRVKSAIIYVLNCIGWHHSPLGGGYALIDLNTIKQFGQNITFFTSFNCQTSTVGWLVGSLIS